jgi:hypothetical protein
MTEGSEWRKALQKCWEEVHMENKQLEGTKCRKENQNPFSTDMHE